MRWIRNILTEGDNFTFSSPRIAGFSVLATFIGLAVGDLVKNGHFDPQAFGIGAGAVMAAFGAAIHMGEPKQEEKR